MILYLHGFRSSPNSRKAMQVREAMAARGVVDEYLCPQLPASPRQAIDLALATVQLEDPARLVLIGSSLGGYYATWLAEKHDARAVLLNPAIDPHAGLRALLGEQKNLHTGEPYLLTEAHLRGWEKLWVPRVTPARYLLIVETGDEVLDYRRALERYAGAEQIVVQGGDHSLQSFERHLPRIVAFAGLAGA
jgi:predicted esterase YcpF (UPF0227 family)